MTTKHLHIMGVDPGGDSGWARLTIPRNSIFGDQEPEILERDYGLFRGPEPEQATNLARKAREIQSLDYKTGVAIIVEAWDQDPTFKSTDPEALSPVRLGAMLALLQHQGKLGDATLHFQSRTIAKTTVTDERLHRLHLYVANDHIRDAHRHAITGLKRARNSPTFARELWPS